MIELLPKQSEFVGSRARRRAFVGGFGCGKTTTGATLAVELAIYYPGSRGLVAGVSYVRHVKDVVVPAILKAIPDHAGIRLKLIDRYLSIIIKRGTMIDRGGVPWKADKDYTSTMLFYGIGRNGDELAFRSEEFDWAIIDEATVCNEHAFKFVETRLGRKSDIGVLAVTMTPDEPSHWMKGYLDDRKFHVVTMKTEENTHLQPSYYTNLRENFPGAYGFRYLDGLWVTLSGAMFTQAGWQLDDQPAERMVITAACDPASSKTGDFFVIAVLGKVEGSSKVFLLDLEVGRGIPILEQVELLRKVDKAWMPARFLVETTGYQETLRQLVEVNVPHITGIKPNTDKMNRAQPLAACWQNGNFVVSNSLGVKQLDMVKQQFFGFPDGDHDDIVDACVYAYSALMRTSTTGVRLTGRPRY